MERTDLDFAYGVGVMDGFRYTVCGCMNQSDSALTTIILPLRNNGFINDSLTEC